MSQKTKEILLSPEIFQTKIKVTGNSETRVPVVGIAIKIACRLSKLAANC